MSPRPALLLAAIAIGLAAPAAQAQWKWKDPKGVVQYSDLPPPAGTPEQDILLRPAAAARNAAAAAAAASAAVAAAPASAPRGVDPQLEARRKAAANEDAERKRADEARQAAVRADNCQRAKGYLRGLEDGQRMARTNAKGEREVLDDKGRADEMRRTREVIASDCAK